MLVFLSDGSLVSRLVAVLERPGGQNCFMYLSCLPVWWCPWIHEVGTKYSDHRTIFLSSHYLGNFTVFVVKNTGLSRKGATYYGIYARHHNRVE